MKKVHLTLFIHFITVKNIFLFHFRNDAVLRFYCHTQSKKRTLSAEKNKEETKLSKGFSLWKKAPKYFMKACNVIELQRPTTVHTVMT